MILCYSVRAYFNVRRFSLSICVVSAHFICMHDNCSEHGPSWWLLKVNSVIIIIIPQLVIELNFNSVEVNC